MVDGEIVRHWESVKVGWGRKWVDEKGRKMYKDGNSHFKTYFLDEN
jgi:hypothetical protein